MTEIANRLKSELQFQESNPIQFCKRLQPRIMYSEDRPLAPDHLQSETDSIPKLQRRTIHPDSLKFMDMAKELLDSPEVQQAIEGEQQKPKDAN